MVNDAFKAYERTGNHLQSKFSACCLSLVVHLDDAHDFCKFPSRLWQRRMTLFARFFFFSPFFLSRSRGRKSQILLASCAQWPISRSGKLSFISLTNSDALSFLLSRSFLFQEKRQRAEKMTDLIFPENVLVVYLTKETPWIPRLRGNR